MSTSLRSSLATPHYWLVMQMDRPLLTKVEVAMEEGETEAREDDIMFGRGEDVEMV